MAAVLTTMAAALHSMTAVLLTVSLIPLMFSTVSSQTISAGGVECCSMFMMDATGYTAIETRRPLTTLAGGETFLGLRIRACTTDPVAVQIWRRVDDTTFQFRWQTQITPVLSSVMRTYITISFESDPITVTPDDRLAVYSLMTSSKLAVPFSTDLSSTNYLYYSTTRFADFNAFQGTTTVTADDLRWPRTFNSSVMFCRQAGCADLQQNVSPVGPTAAAPTAAVTVSTTMGPIGPPGQCCRAPPAVACDPTGINNNLRNQTGKIIELQNTISIITTLINELFASRQVTGTCPPGFTSGSYGVGKCYVLFRESVQMAVGVLRCRDEFKARLLTIETREEETFLKTFVGNNSQATGTENYWTTGMYNFQSGRWFWYDESTRTQTNQIYSAWPTPPGPPAATSDSDVCSALTIDNALKRDYWTKQFCTDMNYFICEVPKTCL